MVYYISPFSVVFCFTNLIIFSFLFFVVFLYHLSSQSSTLSVFLEFTCDYLVFCVFFLWCLGQPSLKRKKKVGTWDFRKKPKAVRRDAATHISHFYGMQMLWDIDLCIKPNTHKPTAVKQ